MGEDRNGGTSRFGRGLADMPDRQAVVLVAAESFGKMTSFLETVLVSGDVPRTIREGG